MDYNFKVDQPHWLLNEINLGEQFETVESRMSLVIKLSELNVDQRTGGRPFVDRRLTPTT